MTLEEIRSALTEREFEYYQALKSEDVGVLDSFGDDGPLLKRSVEAKLSEVKTNQTTVRERELVVPDFTGPGAPRDQVDVLGEYSNIEPLRKSDIIRGNRVHYQASGGIHRVLGVDRSTEPETIIIEMFGKQHRVSRALVRKVAPMEYDPRFRNKRKKPVNFAGSRATRHTDYRHDPEGS